MENYKDIIFKQLRIIKLIFYGTPRAGKTTLRKQLLTSAEDFLQQPSAIPQPSTNIAEICDPVFVERIVMTNEENNEWRWSVQKLDDIAKTLLQCLDNELLHLENKVMENPNVIAAPKSTTPEPLSNINHQHAQIEQMANTSDLSPQITTEGVKYPVPMTLPIVKQDKVHSSSTDLDIKKPFFEAVKTGEWAEVVRALKIEKAMLLHVIDGGGQPSFQEIFPLLINGPSVTLLMFKLTDDLSKSYAVKYQPKDGVEHTWPKDTYVVRDIVFHAISSIVPLTEEDTYNPCYKILLVGTHKDDLKYHKRETTIMEINTSMHGWLQNLAAFTSVPVTNPQDFIIAINNYNPQDILKVKKSVEKLVLQTPSKDIPAPWLVFDFVLHRYAKSEQLRKVEIIKCQQIAKKCGVIDKQFELVLKYLHNEAGTLLYYPELNDCVITDFQLIFDSISKIIVEYFSDNSENGAHDKYKTLYKKGQLDSSVLKNVKGCLEKDELLALMQHRHIISKMDGKMFFMPSVLPKAESYSNKSSDFKSSDFSSFLVIFSHGCCPIGLFCAVTTKLIVTHKWKVKKDAKQWRNKINFYDHSEMYHIIFSAIYDHYEISMDRKAKSSIRYAVYKAVDEAFITVCKDMNYPSPLYGFYCPKDCTANADDSVIYEQNQHPAKCLNDKVMKCCYSDEPSDLTEEHKSWFQQVKSFYKLKLLHAVWL